MISGAFFCLAFLVLPLSPQIYHCRWDMVLFCPCSGASILSKAATGLLSILSASCSRVQVPQSVLGCQNYAMPTPPPGLTVLLSGSVCRLPQCRLSKVLGAGYLTVGLAGSPESRWSVRGAALLDDIFQPTLAVSLHWSRQRRGSLAGLDGHCLHQLCKDVNSSACWLLLILLSTLPTPGGMHGLLALTHNNHCTWGTLISL